MIIKHKNIIIVCAGGFISSTVCKRIIEILKNEEEYQADKEKRKKISYNDLEKLIQTVDSDRKKLSELDIVELGKTRINQMPDSKQERNFAKEQIKKGWKK